MSTATIEPTLSDAQVIASIIEHAAKHFGICPHRIVTGIKTRRTSINTIARRCVMLHLYKAGTSPERIGRVFRMGPNSVVHHLRIAHLMSDHKEYHILLSSLPPYTPPPAARTSQEERRRYHAAVHPI